MRKHDNHKAYSLKRHAEKLTHALQIVNNTPFDVDPADERVLLQNAHLPGFRDQVFQGEALLTTDGTLYRMGVRQVKGDHVTEVIMRKDVGRTMLSERTYSSTCKTTLVVDALFSRDGHLLRYSEVVH